MRVKWRVYAVLYMPACSCKYSMFGWRLGSDKERRGMTAKRRAKAETASAYCRSVKVAVGESAATGKGA